MDTQGESFGGADTPVAYAFLEATRGRPQEAVADIAGVSQSTVSGWMTAKDKGRPIRFRKGETRSHLAKWLMLCEELPGFREGVQFALETLRQPFDELEERLRARQRVQEATETEEKVR